MYTSKFRDKVYEDQHGSPPWICFEHKQNAIRLLSEYLPENVEWKHILDYGCGDGQIWEYYLEKWADVDFAEISEKMVDFLRKKYLYKSKLLDAVWENIDKWKNVQIYKVETPVDIPSEQSYDYILCRCVLHHIDPSMWSNFLDKFWWLLKKWWKLIIAWFDITDEILKQDGNLWHVTWEHSRYINDLPLFIDSSIYEIEETGVYDDKTSAFDVARKMRYFVIRYKE